jgi:hypothetical protein
LFRRRLAWKWGLLRCVVSAAGKKFVEILVSQHVKMNGGASVKQSVCRTFGELRHAKHQLEKVWLASSLWGLL